MPVYVFRCLECDLEHEVLRRLGDIEPPACPDCGAATRHRLGRVGVAYNSWGFTKTDGLVGDTTGKNFKALSEKAQQIADS